MEILVQVAQFLLSLSFLVVFHELGHFAFAKLFGARVEKFYLFFNPWFSLFKVKRGQTEYGMGWLPLGGYVKISGMIDESLDKAQMSKPPQPHEFRSKPAWQRLLIMTGGVLVNLVLALLIYSAVLFTWGEEYLATRNVKYGVACSPLALEMGFSNGDRILTVSGHEVEAFQQVLHDILLNKNRNVVVQRGNDTVTVSIPEDKVAQLIKDPIIFVPRFPFIIDELIKGGAAESAGLKRGDKLVAINNEPKQFFDEFKTAMQENKNRTLLVTVLRDTQTVNITLNVPETGIVGVAHSMNLKAFFEVDRRSYTLLQSFPAGVKRGVSIIKSYLKQLKLIFSPETKAYESLGGPIAIGKIFPTVWDWQTFWGVTAFLSIVFAVMNILPIPALDGGHVLFLLYEIVTGRKPGDKFLEYAQMAGMVVLLALFLYATTNDVVKLFR